MPASDQNIIRDGIRRFNREKKTKLLLSYVSLLVASVKADAKASIAEGRTIERPALLHAIDTFFDCYVSIIATCPAYYYFTRFFTTLSAAMPADDNPLPYVWRSIVDTSSPTETADISHRDLVANYRPGKRAAVEQFYYVDSDDPQHALYQEILQQEQGVFREEISLCRLAQQRFAKVNDHIPVAQFTRMLNTLSKAGMSISASEAEYATVDDLEDIGAMLHSRFLADFAKPASDWREVLVSQLDNAILVESANENQYFPNNHTWSDEAKRRRLMDTVLRLLYLTSSDGWYNDALSLVRQFPAIVRGVIADRLDRVAVLERFLDGASYPMPRC